MSKCSEHSVTLPIEDYEKMKNAVVQLDNLTEQLRDDKKVYLNYRECTSVTIKGKTYDIPKVEGFGEFESKVNDMVRLELEKISGLVKKLEEENREIKNALLEEDRVNKELKEKLTMLSESFDSAESSAESRLESANLVISEFKQSNLELQEKIGWLKFELSKYESHNKDLVKKRLSKKERIEKLRRLFGFK